MNPQFLNDNGVSIINAGTSEGASKGWQTRRGTGDYDQLAAHAERMSAAADATEKHFGNFKSEMNRSDALRDHEKAIDAHHKAGMAAMKAGDRRSMVKHFDAAQYHRGQQDDLRDQKFDYEGP